MGRESASYEVALKQADAAALVERLREAGLERRRGEPERADFCLRDEHRYWIDLRVHTGARPRLEIRVALTNDTWALRAPLERVLTPLPRGLRGVPLRGDAGDDVAIVGADGWLLALEDDYGRRRDEFVACVGDYTAPLSADHVYMYLHQTRYNQDNDDELAWQREREIARMEEAWERGDAPEPEVGDS